MKYLITIIIALLLPTYAIAGEHGHDHGAEQTGHGGHEEGGLIKLSPAQIKQAGIHTTVLRLQAKQQVITAPGTVAFNGYSIADVTTLVDAVVHARHVRLGDAVKKGQNLVTLNSTTLATAEATYLRTLAEYHRNKQELARLHTLAEKKIISQARLQQSESNNQATKANLAAAKATLFSYGLNQREVSRLLKQKVYGLLTLRAPHAGTVVADDFRLGQHLAAGSRLMQVVDESHVWVEINVPEVQRDLIRVGQSASVQRKGSTQQHTGRVITLHHQLDAVTRTAGVRLEIQNIHDLLHPGMFVQAEIAIAAGDTALLIAEQAVQRQGSELIVFVEEEPGHFERREVAVGKANMGMVALLKGVKAGEAVVIEGAFVLVSELAKAGFEVHNH